MAFTAAQMTSFLSDANHMALSVATRAAIAEEVLIDITDIVEFDSDSMKQITDNLRRPVRRVPDPDPDTADGATIPTSTFVFGEKSQIHLKAAVDIVKYYETTGRTQGCDRSRSAKDLQNAPYDEVDGIFSNFTRRVIGTRTIPLLYVIREIVDVLNATPELSHLSGGITRGQFEPFSDDFITVEEELIARATHSYPLYCDDNAAIYFLIEEST